MVFSLFLVEILFLVLPSIRCDWWYSTPPLPPVYKSSIENSGHFIKYADLEKIIIKEDYKEANAIEKVMKCMSARV